jgi:hypothetical protein
MSFIQEPFSGNLSVSGAFFTGTLFSVGVFGRNFLAGTLCAIPADPSGSNNVYMDILDNTKVNGLQK